MAVSPTSSRSEIRTYQQQLNDAGAQPPLVVDGIWGPKTEAAHQEYGGKLDSGESTGEALLGTGEENDPRFGLAGGAELWKNTDTGESYIVYMVPGTESDPIYMRWTVPSIEDVQSFFGPGQPIVYQQEIGNDDAMWTDSVDFGSSDDIANTAKNPFDSWASTLEAEAASQPWLLDDDYQQLLAMAIIENRPLTPGEIATTEWWQTHSDAERKWMNLKHGDPASAEQIIEDGRIQTLNVLRQAGFSDPDQKLVDYMSDKLTMGTWSQEEFNQQVLVLTDAYFEGEPLREDLRAFLTDNDINVGQTSDMELEVQNTVKRWLGTNFGTWDEEQIGYWAGRLRNEPDAAEALVETLKDQRYALFPEYDREADYETIASPWRTVMRNMWGEVPNDSDQMLQQVIRMNDAGEAGKLLTQEGLKRGNDNVVASVQSALMDSFGGTAI